MITDIFKTTFGKIASVSLFTPGRVNLIGEHTDYNGGWVLPTALDIGATLALSLRSDNEVHIFSDKFDDIAERKLTDSATDHWSDYIIGAIVLANDVGLIKGGANVAVATTLPFGAGLSSSAAVIVAVLKACREINSGTQSDTEIAVLARRVENEFIGMPCGIMDQMAVSIARPGQALALDTETLEFELVDLPTDHKMVVIHSGQFRRLSEGRYKERKEECDAVKAALGHNNICQISDDEFKTLSGLSDTLQRRAKHCLTEHRRTLSAAKALRVNDMETLGQLMNESHISMRDDFEITLPKIDKLVDDAVRLGAKGARMTGGGFGGCIVACVPENITKNWVDTLLKANPEAFFVS